MKEEVEERLRAEAVDNTITCTTAQPLADDMGIFYKEKGLATDEFGINIKECQMGCF